MSFDRSPKARVVHADHLMVKSISAFSSTSLVFTLAAQAASAQTTVAPAATPVVNGESLTETTHANGPSERFGDRHEIAMSSDNALTISNTSFSGVSGSTTTIELEPAVDFFIIRSLSVGGFVDFNYVSAGNGHSTIFAVGPRVGYNWTLSDLLSVWPKAGVAFGSKNSTSDAPPGSPPGTPSTSTSNTTVQLNLYVPLMLHPAPHFFVGLGPFLDLDLTGDNKATTFGAKMTFGGWVYSGPR